MLNILMVPAALVSLKLIPPQDFTERDFRCVTVSWIDAGGHPFKIDDVTPKGKSIVLRPPSDAAIFQVRADALISRPMPLKGRPLSDVPLLPAATVRFASSSRTGKGTTVIAVPRVAAGIPLLRLEPEAGGTVVSLWPELYAVAIDREDVPITLANLDLEPGREVAAPASAEGAKFVRLLVKDRRTHSPVARIEFGDRAEPLEQAFVAALRMRLRKGKAPGEFDIGLLPPRVPSVVLSSTGYRSSVVSFENQDDAAPIEVRLAPFQEISIVWNEQHTYRDRKSSVRVARCDGFDGEACTAWGVIRKSPLDSKGAVTIRGALPGLHRVCLTVGDSAGGCELVETSFQDTAPDVVSLALSAREWDIRGRTHLRDGSPLSAIVAGYPTKRERRIGNSEPLFDLKSDTSGAFSGHFFAAQDLPFSLFAKSVSPLAEGHVFDLRVTPTLENEDLDVPLDGGGLRVKVRERLADEKIEGCPVSARLGEGAHRSQKTQLTNSEGVAVFLTGEKVARVRAECEGYVRPDETIVELESDSLKDLEIVLDRARTLNVLVVGVDGSPLPAASVLVLERLPAPGQPGFWHEPTLAGVTTTDGLLSLPGDRFGGRPFYVVAPHLALYVGWLPTAAGGNASEPQRIDVQMNPPFPIPGIRVLSASGDPQNTSWLGFEKNGVPIPMKILQELAAANGVPPGGFFAGDANIGPSYFGPGEYSVGYIVTDKETRLIKTVPLGAIRLPTTEAVVLRAMFIP